MKRILVRGSGDVGSAVAHTLFRAGYAVLIQDSAQPTATRRKMAFCDAIFDGAAILEGVYAQLVAILPDVIALLSRHELIPITTIDVSLVLTTIRPDVLVDARMRKHDQPETQITLAPLTIGLGPNFVAGETVHAGVETGWNDGLGQVIWQGATRPLEGEPQSIAGHARGRYVYAPIAGVFQTTSRIGDLVTAGQKVANIGDVPLHAPIDGILRGLTHDSVPVAKKGQSHRSRSPWRTSEDYGSCGTTEANCYWSAGSNQERHQFRELAILKGFSHICWDNADVISKTLRIEGPECYQDLPHFPGPMGNVVDFHLYRQRIIHPHGATQNLSIEG